jgi:hypothetical protein
MTHFPHGAFVAIHAAQEAKKKEEEEEEMTRYTSEEMDSNWEFKIVRSESGAFRKPEVFQQLVQEESMAGWELLEKLDDRRVRFKRPSDARRRDATLPPGYDPYRTQYGSAVARTIILIAVALLLAAGVGAAILFNAGSGGDPTPVIGITVGIIALIVAIALVAVRRSQFK